MPIHLTFEPVLEVERIAAFVQRLYPTEFTEETYTTLHPYRVAQYTNTYDEEVVALLHDVVEDGLATWDEIYELLGGESDPRVQALKALTRIDGESYDDYIGRILAFGNDLAVCVKFFDLFDHLDPHHGCGLNEGKTARYVKALGRLALARTKG